MASCSVCVYDANTGLALAANRNSWTGGRRKPWLPWFRKPWGWRALAFRILAHRGHHGSWHFYRRPHWFCHGAGPGRCAQYSHHRHHFAGSHRRNETAESLPIVVAVDARAGEIYFAAFDQSGHEITAPVVVTSPDAHKFMPRHSARIFGDGGRFVFDQLDATAFAKRCRRPADCRKFCEACGQHPCILLPPEPLYLRAAGCETASHKNFLQRGRASCGKTAGGTPW